jgi:hypothetical protein
VDTLPDCYTDLMLAVALPAHKDWGEEVSLPVRKDEMAGLTL